MEKFSVNENKKHWNEYAKKHKNAPEGASFDSNLVILENLFINSRLKILKQRSLLDIGCGNGQRTFAFSKYVKGITIGIDYSKNMIEQAKKLQKKNLKFYLADIWDFDNQQNFDIIISSRCFINQTNSKNQIKLFKLLHRMLKPKGHLIIAEASVEGLKNLNRGRKFFRLEPIGEHWFNVHIKESLVFPKIKHLFSIKAINRLGLFYYIARVLHPAYVFPKKDKRSSKFNTIAKDTQIQFFGENTFEKFGRHLLVDFQKK